MGKGSGGCDRQSMVLDSISESSNSVLAVESALTKAELQEILDDINEKEWREADEVDLVFSNMTAQALNIHPITALKLDGPEFISDDFNDQKTFLYPTRKDINLKNNYMSSAAKAVLDDIENKNLVAVFADYDVDGNTSGWIIENAVKNLGGSVKVYYASAADGFGLNNNVVDVINSWKAKTLITVDCGSTQTDAISYAQSLGIKVIVIDHHDVDMDNTCNYHLNPRYIQGIKKEHLDDVLSKAKNIKKDFKNDPAALSEAETKYLNSIKKLLNYKGEISLANLIKKAEKKSATMMDEEMGTGAQLTWKFGSELYKNKLGSVPDEWFKTPLYLAGLGAMADMANMKNQENRAFVRVPLDESGLDVIPTGIKKLAEHFEEDPSITSSLIRTRAALNLAKRTSRISASEIVDLYNKNYKKVLDKIIAEHTSSTEARDAMEAEINNYIENWSNERKLAKKSSKHKYWVHAVCENESFVDYVGQSGVLADRLAKSYGLPAVVFTPMGKDADGYDIVKWSSRNNQVKAKIGGLLDPVWKEPLSELCAKSDKPGELSKGAVGGHEDVVSGTCRTENIDEVVKLLNKFAESKNKEDWTKRKYSSLKVAARNISSDDLVKLESDSLLLEPLNNGNFAQRVSVQAAFTEIKEYDADIKGHKALMNVGDLKRECIISGDVIGLIDENILLEAAIYPTTRTYYIKNIKL